MTSRGREAVREAAIVDLDCAGSLVLHSHKHYLMQEKTSKASRSISQVRSENQQGSDESA